MNTHGNNLSGQNPSQVTAFLGGHAHTVGKYKQYDLDITPSAKADTTPQQQQFDEGDAYSMGCISEEILHLGTTCFECLEDREFISALKALGQAHTLATDALYQRCLEEPLTLAAVSLTAYETDHLSFFAVEILEEEEFISVSDEDIEECGYLGWLAR